MQKLVPCLWFDSGAEEAAKFYTNIFPNSKVIQKEKYNVDTPSNKKIGSVMTVEFEISGYRFLGLNGGPYFKPNPSISFMVNCDTKEEVDNLFKKLSNGKSKVLMPLDKYPFSDRYVWLEDKYGFSWQLILTKSKKDDKRTKIVPNLLFTGENYGNAKKAVDLYLSVFKDSKLGNMIYYDKNQEPNKEGTVMFSDFKIKENWISAMDGGGEHGFKFNEGISFIIYCKDQEEINYFYSKLSKFPEAEMCGWLKDEYGVSWQLVTVGFEKFMSKKEVMEEMLKMKRLDIKKLEEIYKKSK